MTELGSTPAPWCCSQEHIFSDYYTMSASGVVHMFRDGSPAEFTPIGDWVREHSVFNMMKQVGGGRGAVAREA
jgi:dynein heavy chain